MAPQCGRLGDVMADAERALPRYGLGGSFAGQRLREGSGGDICTTLHLPDGTSEELIVGVVRRATGRRRKGEPRIPIPSELAAKFVATVVVMTPLREVDKGVDVNALVDELNALARKVARDEHAWTAREIIVDGEMVAGWEWEYAGIWALYHLTEDLILYVTGPTALRPEKVELRPLRPDEVGPTRLDDGGGGAN
jgi:hypothetical protein